MKTRSVLSRLVALAALCCVSVSRSGAVASVIFPEYAKGGELWKSIQAQNQMLFEVNAPELWFTQQIDHFASTSDSNDDMTTNTTYQQRYYEVNTFWSKPNGPVILYIGGEGALTNAPSGFVSVLAQKFGAKVCVCIVGLCHSMAMACLSLV